MVMYANTTTLLLDEILKGGPRCVHSYYGPLSDGYKEVLLAHLKVCIYGINIMVDTSFLRFLRLRIAISSNHLLQRNGTRCALNLFKL